MGQSSLKGILIDVGGVLLRTRSQESRQAWERRLGLREGELSALVSDAPVSLEATLGKVPEISIWENLAAVLHLTPEEIVELKADFWRYDELDEDLVTGLQSFRPKVKTGILSNAWPNGRRLFTETHHLGDKVDQIFISAELGLAKPDPRIYQYAAQQLGLLPAEIVFIDDMLVNVEGARKTGMQGIQFTDTHELMQTLNSFFK